VRTLQAFQSYLESNPIQDFAVVDCINDLKNFLKVTGANVEKVVKEDVEAFVKHLTTNKSMNLRSITTVKVYIDFLNGEYKQTEAKQPKQSQNMKYLEPFVGHLEERSKLTISSYISDVRQFLGFISKDIQNLKKDDIEAFKQDLNGKGFKVKTINRKLVSVKQFIDFLNEKKGLGIAVKIKPEKQQRQDYLEEMLDKEDFEKMVRAAVGSNDTRAKAIFYTLLYTGMRVSEMLQLEVNDIEKEYISVKGKGSKYRDIFVPARLRTVWVEYVKERSKTSEKLFTGQRGPINRQTVHNMIKKYAKLSGVSDVKAHAHNFRHFYCKMLIDKGTPIDTVADLAGHSDINTTRIYTRKTRKELMAAINGL
jgi:integrase/recombinase XerD